MSLDPIWMHISQYLFHSFAPSLFEKDGTAYDFGANHGGFTEYLAKRFKHVVCVEPNPRFALEQLAGNLTVLRCAVGWPASTAWLRLDDVHVYSSLDEMAKESDKVVRVDVMTLGQVFEGHNGDVVDFVKMDVEGSELDILLHESPETLQRIKQLTVEFHDFLDPASLPRVKAALARMRELGFEVLRFSLTNHGDVLFLNRRFVHIGWIERGLTMLCFGWIRGIKRKLHRVLWPKADPPGAYTLLE